MTTVDRPLAEQYAADGFCIAPPLVDAAELPAACAVMDSLISGDYPTGVAPLAVDREPGDDDPTRLDRIDQPQMADHRVTDLIVGSRIGELAAAITGADLVQVWAMQLIRKPSIADPSRITANVGWHQDDDYWHRWWDGEVFTCWLALSDVTDDAGPVRFVVGSHRWGFLDSGDFFSPDLASSPTRTKVPAGEAWVERPAVVAAGGASFHDRLTLHGSGPNTSGRHRRSYAVHLRTDRSTMLPGIRSIYRDQITDPVMSPVLFAR
jgi:ectoine hydroxylase-related dioxygenase (phytanoyl-CoA dioxygenase family)